MVFTTGYCYITNPLNLTLNPLNLALETSQIMRYKQLHNKCNVNSFNMNGFVIKMSRDLVWISGTVSYVSATILQLSPSQGAAALAQHQGPHLLPAGLARPLRGAVDRGQD